PDDRCHQRSHRTNAFAKVVRTGLPAADGFVDPDRPALRDRLLPFACVHAIVNTTERQLA
ncbi:MAG: hypothetical protein WD359_01395, partial [Dehalococcoidia bacterium]